MKTDAILANHAEATNNLLYVNGGGVNRLEVPAAAQPPYGATLCVGVIVHVPHEELPQTHTIAVDLEDGDGRPVEIAVGPGRVAALHRELGFQVGNTPGLPAGTAQPVAMAFPFTPLPFPAAGQYAFALRVNGEETARLPFSVTLV